MNEDIAELVGIILGDGYLHPTRLMISLNTVVDTEYIPYVTNLLTSIFGINPIIKPRKTDSTTDLFIFKRDIIKILVELGLRYSPKYERAVIPEAFLKHGPALLRGYLDTDGCVAIVNNNGTLYPRIEFKLCSSPMQKQYVQLLKELNFNFGVYPLQKGAVRVQLNGIKQLKLWTDTVGFSHPKNKRKAQYFLRK